jgi:Ca2+-binding EF-hand superfamily protein
LASTISSAIFLKEENLREAFSNLDKDKKGYFDVSDLKNAIGDPELKLNSQEFEKVFLEAFPNGK